MKLISKQNDGWIIGSSGRLRGWRDSEDSLYVSSVYESLIRVSMLRRFNSDSGVR